MAEFRELYDAGPEEAFRVMFAGLQRHLHTAMVAIVSEASDGHNVSAVPATQQVIVDPTRTQTTYENFPLIMGMPAHYVGGARAVLTHGHAPGDEIIAMSTSRSFGPWRQSGGNQQPETDRIHSLSDCVALSGVRSDPRRLKQVDPQAMHARSDDKLHCSELHPDRGHRTFSADPSTPPASDSFDPLSQASKFIDHAVQGASGLLGRAVSGDTVHSHGVTHDDGAFMRALGALHQVLCHPAMGALLSAADGAHTVTASPSGVTLQSVTSIGLDCPPSGLSLPAGGVGGSALAPGAAASNVGQLGGDLGGTLPSPTVTGLAHVDGRALPAAASDAGAAAAGVALGGLYRNTAVASGVSLLAVRMV